MAFEEIDIQEVSGNQVINIPESFKINDSKVYLKKVGESLYIIPFHNPWQNMMSGIHEFSDDFMENREQPNEQSRESFD